MAKVDFYFDFLSPYSYLATFRLPRLRAEFGAEIVFHVVDLEAAKQAIGNTRPASHLLPRKLRYLKTDLARWAARYQAPLAFPETLAHVDLKAAARLNRGFLYATRRGAGEAYLTAAFAALWQARREPSEATLKDVAAKAGLDPRELAAAADAPETIAEYARENLEAQARGVFGVPTFVVGDQLFWGNDRIDFLEEYLRDPGAAVHL
ncbi:MAG TPA: 2-hydroxychromene-2-carboxylate isomerase [Candidatus Binataceae bacterium]|nr:2-hydroxychromene-2-carboxylate isomerase [Candidatus Binataceae bacterium]